MTRAKEYTANRANMGQNTRMDTDPVAEAVVQKANPEPQPEPEPATATLETGTESPQEIKTVREELAAQEALREKEREQRKLAKEERRRIEESLLKSHANNDRLKEEREKLQQEKDKLHRQAEIEIERLKRNSDRLCGQVN